ncbi:FAD:protein FMN transferase [Ottowia thiooxydans]|uniref:FAD:protein FMN transferase n=1 Tax=Ottowia thiooxydans TaxID=219182 RepID=A0ABV2Q4V0_9BURK
MQLDTLSNRVFLPVDSGKNIPAVPRAGDPMHRFEGTAMGTHWSVQAYAPKSVDPQRLHSAIMQELAHAIKLFSTWQADSEVARCNAASAGDWQFSAPCWTLLESSLAWAQSSGGAVDPTLGALVNLWGFGPTGPRPERAPLPTQHEIDAALRASGWRNVQIDTTRRTLHKPAGLQLDFSGIAKGWAVDQVSSRLVREGACVHLVEIGGELKSRGLRHDLQPWWVLMQNRGGNPRSLLALVDMAVATSGDTHHHFNHQGRRYSHTLDGQSGWPIAHGTASVTVLHPQAMQADLHATVLTVMEPERALDWAETHELAALLTVRNCQGVEEHISTAMMAMLDS